MMSGKKMYKGRPVDGDDSAEEEEEGGRPVDGDFDLDFASFWILYKTHSNIQHDQATQLRSHILSI